MARSNKIMGTLDTNILLRWLLNDIPKQTHTVDKLIKTGVYSVPDMVLIEVVFVLERVYKMPRDIIESNIRIILHNKNLICNVTFFENVLSVYAKEQKLSILDCAIAIHADKKRQTPVYTFDKAFAKALSHTVEIPNS